MKDYFKRTAMIEEAESTSKGHPLWLESLIFILVYLIANIVQVLILVPVFVVYILTDKEFLNSIFSGATPPMEVYGLISDNILVYMLFSTIAIILTALIYCRYIEKRSFRSMGFVKRGLLKEYALGILVGAVMFTVAVLLCTITGSISITGFSPGFALGAILLFFLGYMVQGMSEELFCRGYFMVSVARKHSLITAIIANSILFSLFHLLNSGVTILAIINITLFGIFASVYMLKRGNIWGVAAVHTSWNFVQGNIFGIKVSGINMTNSLLSTDVSDRYTILNGGSFGLEGGLAVTIVLIIAILLLTFVKNKDKQLDNQLSECYNPE